MSLSLPLAQRADEPAMIEHVDAPLMLQHTLGTTTKLRPARMIDR